MDYSVAVAYINHAMNALRNDIIELEKSGKNKSKIKKLETQMNKLYSVLNALGGT